VIPQRFFNRWCVIVNFSAAELYRIHADAIKVMSDYKVEVFLLAPLIMAQQILANPSVHSECFHSVLGSGGCKTYYFSVLDLCSAEPGILVA